MGERTANVQPAALGETIEELVAIIASRSQLLPEGSYTTKLLSGSEDKLLAKVVEEAAELLMAAKDRDHDHLRYEAADLVYHLLVALQRYNVTPEELAGELRARM
jgi:phosphoribosyl-ATP pyrophosphohydrolase